MSLMDTITAFDDVFFLIFLQELVGYVSSNEQRLWEDLNYDQIKTQVFNQCIIYKNYFTMIYL